MPILTAMGAKRKAASRQIRETKKCEYELGSPSEAEQIQVTQMR
jgi:hypothetical protein